MFLAQPVKTPLLAPTGKNCTALFTHQLYTNTTTGQIKQQLIKTL
jgi:hypothetical protein